MADELDLETGVPEDADSAATRRRRRRERGKESGSNRGSSDTAVEAEIRSRLDRTFDRIAKAREAREDEELASVIREDADAMAQGFISLTHNIPFLRMPLIMALNILEPLLAFSRVGRILIFRWYERRIRKQEEREAVAQEYEVDNGGAPVVAQ